MTILKKLLLASAIGFGFCSSAFAYTGAKEFIVYKGPTKIHVIDNFKTLVVISITENPFARASIECGTFPFDEKARTGKFGENFVDFNDKDYGLINGSRKFYVGNKLNLTLYKKVCNNFKLSTPEKK